MKNLIINNHSILMFDGSTLVKQIKQSDILSATKLADSNIIKLENKAREDFDIDFATVKTINEKSFDASITTSSVYGALTVQEDLSFDAFCSDIEAICIFSLSSYLKTSGPAGAVLTAKYNFTPTEIRSLKSTPVKVVPSPGAGKAIRLINATLRCTTNTTGYDNGQPFGLTVQGANEFVATDTTNIVDGNTTVMQNLEMPTTPPLGFVEDAALIATLTPGLGGDATQGDNQIDLYIMYEIITL